MWVKGCATKVHIDREITTTLDKGGNDAAHALASAAEAHHAAPQAPSEAATKRHLPALSTHVFVVELPSLQKKCRQLARPITAEHWCKQSTWFFLPTNCIQCYTRVFTAFFWKQVPQLANRQRGAEFLWSLLSTLFKLSAQQTNNEHIHNVFFKTRSTKEHFRVTRMTRRHPKRTTQL